MHLIKTRSPVEHVTIEEPQSPSIDVSEQHQTEWSNILRHYIYNCDLFGQEGEGLRGSSWKTNVEKT